VAVSPVGLTTTFEAPVVAIVGFTNVILADAMTEKRLQADANKMNFDK
jgi:hypothetical protein